MSRSDFLEHLFDNKDNTPPGATGYPSDLFEDSTRAFNRDFQQVLDRRAEQEQHRINTDPTPADIHRRNIRQGAEFLHELLTNRKDN